MATASPSQKPFAGPYLRSAERVSKLCRTEDRAPEIRTHTSPLLGGRRSWQLQRKKCGGGLTSASSCWAEIGSGEAYTFSQYEKSFRNPGVVRTTEYAGLGIACLGEIGDLREDRKQWEIYRAN